MHDHQPTVVSTSDHDRLQAVMCTMIGWRTPIASLLRHKLGSALVMFPDEMPPDVVVPGRRVHFTIDGSRTDMRVLTWNSPARDTGMELSLLVPRGLALLGLRAGQSFSYTTMMRRTELIEVDNVVPGEDTAPPNEPRHETPVALDRSDRAVAAASWDPQYF
jgi:regulator of nucleoside diphosphate kinase